MTEREKIISIIEQNKYCDVNTTANCRECRYNKELANYKDMGCSSLKIADALIAANIGDVTEYKKTIRDLNTDVVAYRALSKADTLEQIIEGQKSLIDEYKHRAEVAERALLLMARGECTFASPEFYKEEAEKEIAMEEQMMANRCGEGKCEYFESIRRAANNNRGNGYCKKYKRELHLYDWWWLKCDECAAEKEIAEEG